MRIAFGGFEGKSALLDGVCGGGVHRPPSINGGRKGYDLDYIPEGEIIPLSGASSAFTTGSSEGLNLFNTHGVGRVPLFGHGGVDDRAFYARIRIKIRDMPFGGTVRLMGFSNTTAISNRLMLRLNPNGRIGFATQTSSLIGLADTILQENVEYVIEMSAVANGSGTNLALRVDGGPLEAVCADAGNTAINIFWLPDEFTNVIVDDWAVNDDQGATNNSWCGRFGRVAILRPESVIADDNWGGNFAGISTTPPIGRMENYMLPDEQIFSGAFDPYEVEFPAWETILPPDAIGLVAAYPCTAVARSFSEGSGGDHTAGPITYGLSMSPDGAYDEEMQAQAQASGILYIPPGFETPPPDEESHRYDQAYTQEYPRPPGYEGELAKAFAWSFAGLKNVTNHATAPSQVMPPITDFAASPVDTSLKPRAKIRPITHHDGSNVLHCCALFIMVEYETPGPSGRTIYLRENGVFTPRVIHEQLTGPWSPSFPNVEGE